MNGGERAWSTASLSETTHARFDPDAAHASELDAVLHLSRYQWSDETVLSADVDVVDLGSGTGFGVRALAGRCRSIRGVDLMALPRSASDPPHVEFLRGDVTDPEIVAVLGARSADVVLSMETIEHLEDYPAFVDNVAALLRPDGVAVIGTPNRTMTYNRYPGRSHMDPSHVQEFTAPALDAALRRRFGDVTLWFQWIPGWFDGVPVGADPPAPAAPRRRRPVVRRVAGMVRRRLLRRRPVAEPAAPAAALRAEFTRVDERPDLALDAFALVAVCRDPRPLAPG